MLRTCNKCFIEKVLEKDFHKRSDGYRLSCRDCYNASVGKTRSLKMKKRRKDYTFTAHFILRDSKNSDKKKNYKNDLDEEFISHLIKNGCSYCGEKEIRLSLDRKDNSLGHLKSNVVSSCSRCNFIKNDMPQEAWEILVPAVKLAKNLGKFNGWLGGIHRKK